MRILDRYILKSFLVNYLLALCVLIGLYVLMDVIVNIHDFANGAAPGPAAKASAWEIVSDMADYYLYQLPVVFQQVAGIIPLLAAGFTMVRMTRHNELTAMLASGVSLYRVAAPIIALSMAFSVLHIINQEFVISQPFMIEKLLRRHNEVNVSTVKNAPIRFIKDSDESYLSALEYCPARRISVSLTGPDAISRSSGSFKEDGLRPGYVVNLAGFQNPSNNGAFTVTAVSNDQIQVKGAHFTPESSHPGAALSVPAAMNDLCIVYRQDNEDVTKKGTPTGHTIANVAQWLPDPTADPNAGPPDDVWVLHDVNTTDDLSRQPGAWHLDVDVRRRCRNPAHIELILSKKAVDFLSSSRVHELAKTGPAVSRPLLLKIMHLRFTQPIMNIIMLLIGIPFLLTREPNKLMWNMIYCTVVSGFIFVATFVLFQLGGNQIPPIWAAWLPVLIFGPFSAVMLDTIRT